MRETRPPRALAESRVSRGVVVRVSRSAAPPLRASSAPLRYRNHFPLERLSNAANALEAARRARAREPNETLARAYSAATLAAVAAGAADATLPLLAGDASVDSLVAAAAPARVRADCGARRTRLIVLLREPVERMYSQFLMRLRLGNGRVTANSTFARFAEANVQAFRKRVDLHGPEWHLRAEPPQLFAPAENAINEGAYAPHLRRWLAHFPRGALLALLSDDFFRAPADSLRLALAFLGLDADAAGFDVDAAAAVKHNANVDNNDDHALSERRFDPARHGLADGTRHMLHEVFAPYNADLERLLERELPWHAADRTRGATMRRARRF